MRSKTPVALVVAAVVLATLVISVPRSPSVSAAEPDDSMLVEVTGHGWGHGRGMGQYGAQGYALNEGWSSAQILDHFYGDTTAGQIPPSAPVDPNAVRVDLRGQRGEVLLARVEAGGIHLRDHEGVLLWANEEGKAIRLSLTTGGIHYEQADGCGGPWTSIFVIDRPYIELIDLNPADDPTGLLQVCESDGGTSWYDGTISYNNVEGAARTVNIVSIEQYLRGVLPAEVPRSWEMAALESQAVAARSYAMAGDTRQLPYGDTCDTTLCQVYRGRYRKRPNEGIEASTDVRTDAAVTNTAGLVRIRNGGVARTEFSSSTGGYTAGGDFPSVEDLGDSVESNPNHDWTKVVNLAGWVASQNKGDLVAIDEVGNGLGEDGGRVLNVTFTFTGGTTVLTGNEARREFGLKSDWFRFGELNTTVITANGHFAAAAYQLFLQRPPSLTEQINWQTRLDAGVAKTELTEALAGSDEWAGVMIDDLYQVVLGRPSDPSGRDYWLSQMAGGLRFEQVAANFFGAPEYYDRVGGTDAAFVTALYDAILGRSADSLGLGFWVDQLETGAVTPYQVAAGFYASPESRQDRVTDLYQRILGRQPDAAGLAHWTERLLTVDDVELAATLAASEEFFAAAQP